MGLALEAIAVALGEAVDFLGVDVEVGDAERAKAVVDSLLGGAERPRASRMRSMGPRSNTVGAMRRRWQ